MAKGTTKVSKRGKTATVWRGALFDDVKGVQVGKTSHSKNGMTATKWSIKKSSTGMGNPRKGKKGKVYTGGGF